MQILLSHEILPYTGSDDHPTSSVGGVLCVPYVRVLVAYNRVLQVSACM